MKSLLERKEIWRQQRNLGSLFLLGRIPLGVITQSRVVEGGCDSLLHSFVSRARS